MQATTSTRRAQSRMFAAAICLMAAIALVLAVAPAQAHADTSWKRLAGGNAYGTMAKVSAQGWSKSDVVVVANFDGFWDALSASSIAGRYKAPILLTGTSSLNATTAAEIKRLGATRAIIVGGTAAISNRVASQIKNVLKGSKVVNRYWGDNARNTAVCVADELDEFMSDTCIIATQKGYWDALAASPYAYATCSPIYLTTDAGTIDELVLAAIEREQFKRAIIVGGTGVVAQSTEALLGKIGIADVKRFGGKNAYETSRLFSNWAASQQGMGADHMGVATAGGYWDALCGAALCGKKGGVILLADDRNTTALGFASAHKAQIKRAYVFGGTSAVGAKAFAACQKATMQAKAQAAV